MNPTRFNHAIIMEIEANAAKKDTVAAIRTSIPSIRLLVSISSTDLRVLAPNIAGIASKRENRAAVLRSYPRNLAIVIVKPARLAPGIKANA